MQIQQPRGQRHILLGFQYFVQGLTWILPTTLIYTYPKVPSYFILSLFEISKATTAIKFLISPFVETYNSMRYGRRKTWIMVGLFGMIITCFMTSFVSTYEYVLIAGLLAIPHMFLNATQDVALDALCLKQLADAEEISYLQSAWNRGGRIFGSFVFMKLVSTSFANKLGLQESIMTPSSFYLLIALMIVSLAIYFHFSYQQPTLQSQIEFSQNNTGFCNTLKYFKNFVDPTRRQYRLSVFFIIIYQGLLFFSKTYKFQLMRNGQSQERINEFENYSIFPIMFVAYFYGKLVKNNLWFHLKLLMYARFFFYLAGFIIKPTSFYGLLFYVSLDNCLEIFRYLVDTILVNIFPVTEFSAMTVSTLNSAWNMGETSFVHMWIIGWIGHSYACIIGFILQFLIILQMNRLCNWVQEGKVDDSTELDLE